MKARLINDFFAGVYKNDWLTLNADRVVNGVLVSDWVVIDTIPTRNELDTLIKPFWNGVAYIEGATQQEQDEYNSGVESREDEQENLLEKRDAERIINKYNEKLKRKVKNGELTTNQTKAIRNGIKSILQCLVFGWWDIAKDEAAALPDVANPTIQAEIDFIKQQINNY